MFVDFKKTLHSTRLNPPELERLVGKKTQAVFSATKIVRDFFYKLKKGNIYLIISFGLVID